MRGRGPYAAYFAIEKKLPVRRERSEWIADFTEGKKDSLAALTPHEYKAFIQFLNQMTLVDKKQSDTELRQRRKVIALLCQQGYVNEERKPDMRRIDGWVKAYGRTHQSLSYVKGDDLSKLVTQVQIMYNKFLKGL